jgi:hypothetical protein
VRAGAARGRGDQEGQKGQPQDGGERLYHREWQFDGQDAEPILRKEYGNQADPSEPESDYEEGHHRVVGNQAPEWGIERGGRFALFGTAHQSRRSLPTNRVDRLVTM